VNIETIIQTRFVAVATPVDSDTTTEVVSVHLEEGVLTIEMASEHWDVTVVFPQSYGFRVLDELDLTDFFPQCSLAHGWLFEVLNGGWKDLELSRERFLSGRNAWVREYLLVGRDECVSVLTKEDPIVSQRAG
jgi:hypothetical protein